MERLGRARFNQRFVDAPIFGKIGAVAIDRLLKITDHAKVTGAGRIRLGLEPIASGIRRARQFKQKRKLSRIGILRFVEDDTKRFFPNFAPDFGMFR